MASDLTTEVTAERPLTFTRPVTKSIRLLTRRVPFTTMQSGGVVMASIPAAVSRIQRMNSRAGRTLCRWPPKAIDQQAVAPGSDQA
jgi:hypothetical protein